jgi:hypothetical protein
VQDGVPEVTQSLTGDRPPRPPATQATAQPARDPRARATSGSSSPSDPWAPPPPGAQPDRHTPPCLPHSIRRAQHAHTRMSVEPCLSHEDSTRREGVAGVNSQTLAAERTDALALRRSLRNPAPRAASPISGQRMGNSPSPSPSPSGSPSPAHARAHDRPTRPRTRQRVPATVLASLRCIAPGATPGWSRRRCPR